MPTRTVGARDRTRHNITRTFSSFASSSRVTPMRVIVTSAALGLFVLAAGCRKPEPTPEPPEFREYRSEEGQFVVRWPIGTVQKRVDPVNGIPTTGEGVEAAGELYMIGYGYIPSGSGYDLEQGVASFSRSGGGKFTTGGGGKHGQDGWRDFEVAGAQAGGVRFEYASGRVLVVRGRFYILTLFGPAARLDSPAVKRFLDSFRVLDGDLPWNRPAQPPPPDPAEDPNTQPKSSGPDTTAQGKPRTKSSKASATSGQMIGWPHDPEFRDDAPGEALLVGFEVGLDKDFDYPIVGTMRPIYRADGKETFGRTYGTKREWGTVKVVAKEGYAVGAITVRAGFGIEGFSLTFMRVDGEQLDPRDAYESEWMGKRSGGSPPKTLSGDGAPVVGVVGRHGGRERVTAVGLVFRGR